MLGQILLAVVKLAGPFADGAVLQRDAKVAIWGAAEAGEEVTVSFAGQSVRAVTGTNGSWRVDLEPMPACKEGRDLVVRSAQGSQTIHDVLVGEVWFVSGQSNAVCPFWCDVATRFRTITTGGLMVQYVDKPTVRFTDEPGSWKRMNRENLVKKTAIEHEWNACAGSFSALGTFFALKLEDVLDVPVGMIGEYVNGSPIEHWIAPEGRYWKNQVERWAPYSIRGLLWNQGDSNRTNAFEYASLMKRLYDGWCTAFEHPGMSIYFMEQSHGTSDCFELQLAQQRFAAAEPHAAICAGNDLPNMSGDWHGNDKEPMARRMLVHALRRDYGFGGIEDESPTFSHVVGVESNAVTLAFDHATGFYVYNTAMTDYRVPFEACGSDGVWKPAKLVFTPQENWASQGLILSSNLTVVADGVADPRRVRYLHSGKGNVYSQVCLPLLPFETEVRRPLKVLMIGNSFSISVLNQMPQVAKAAGCPLDLVSACVGGCPMKSHLERIESCESNPATNSHYISWNYVSRENPLVGVVPKDKDGNTWGNLVTVLKADKWDVVTIQQASHESWRPESFHPWGDRLVEKIRKYAPQAKIVVQQTWSYSKLDGRICDKKTKGPGSWGIDQLGMYERLTDNYRALAEKNGFDIIPTGLAVQLFRAMAPRAEDVVGTVSPKGVDSIHLNPRGEYLQACVWTAKLFGADIRDISYAPTELGSAKEFATMRHAAMEAVRLGVKAREAWQDNSRLSEGKEKPRAAFAPFSSEEKALGILPEFSDRQVSLDSDTEWKFNWAKDPESRPQGFWRPDYDVTGWPAIKVPCSWQACGANGKGGWGTALYTNITYPFQKDVPGGSLVTIEPPTNYTAYAARNPVGSYRRDFEVSKDWIGERIFLKFDGVDSFFYLWVNGEYIGFSKDSRSPAEFDVTAFVKSGRNTVALEVYRYSDGSYLEDQDMFRLSGIFRRTWLVRRPADRIRDFFVTARPVKDGDFAGDWEMNVEVEGEEVEVDNGRCLFIRLMTNSFKGQR